MFTVDVKQQCNNNNNNDFETAVVNEPSVFEPLKFYCNFKPLISTINMCIFASAYFLYFILHIQKNENALLKILSLPILYPPTECIKKKKSASNFFFYLVCFTCFTFRATFTLHMKLARLLLHIHCTCVLI